MKNGVYQILHVEDNSAQLRNYQYTLKGALDSLKKTFEIVGASNKQEAAAWIFQNQKDLDLIILDIDLGSDESESGLTLVENIYELNPRIPIYVLSTNVDKFKGALDAMKTEQKIRGYDEPLRGSWPDDIRQILEGIPVSVLHLSDIHEGKFFAYDNLVLDKPTLLTELCNTIEHVDFVVVSGDLSSTNTDEDYQKARELLYKVKEHLHLHNCLFVFAPGNHDQNWDATDIHDTRIFSNYLHFINEFYAPEKHTDTVLYYPIETLADDYTTQQSIFDNLISVCAFPDKKTVVVSMNSVNPRDKREKKTTPCSVEKNSAATCGLLSGGEISTEQIQNVKNMLNQLFREHPDTEKYARIATFHHNIFEPSHIERFTWCPTILNEGNLMKFLGDYGFRFVLHGHLHHAENYMFCVGNKNPGISVISTGTLSGTDRNMDRSFCANKVSFYVDNLGRISDAKLTRYTLPNDDYQWKTETIPIRFLDQ